MVNGQSAQATARAAATRKLIDLHPEDWDEIYGDEREARGLPREVGAKSRADTIRFLRYRIAELEEQVAGATA